MLIAISGGETQQDTGNAVFFGRQLQSPPGYGGNFAGGADDGGQAGRLQTFLHGPKNVCVVFAADLDDAVGIDAERLQTLAAKSIFPVAPENRPTGFKVAETGEQNSRKSQRGRVAEDFVQAVGGEAVPGQGMIDLRCAQGDNFGQNNVIGDRRTATARSSFNGLNLIAQIGDDTRIRVKKPSFPLWINPIHRDMTAEESFGMASLFMFFVFIKFLFCSTLKASFGQGG